MEISGPELTRPSAFSPLRSRIFLAIWLAAMASNIGTLIQSVGEKWQMTQLTQSPLLVALIETGTMLPIMVLGLAAGAFADILDRRRLLIATQIFMMIVAGSLATLTFLQYITPPILLAMSLMIGIGSALSMPAFQAIVPELLPQKELGGGVALNSAGYNVSRAIGPAVGGLVVSWFGAGWAFMLNAVSFLAVVFVLWNWKRQAPATDLPSERFLGAMKVGFRYVRHSRPLQVILLRTFSYIWFSGIIFSLLPTLAIHVLGMESKGFGGLMSCIGAGAVSVTFVMPKLRQRFKANQLMGGFTVLTVLAHTIIAFVPHTLTVGFCLFLTGASWLAIFSTLNTAIQLSVPSWVKARAFGGYQMAWGGAMALSAAFWGAVALRFGIPVTFAVSAAGMLLGLVLIGGIRITAFDEEQDLSPHQDAPHPRLAISMDAGPILVQLEFDIKEGQREDFLSAMQGVRSLRLRDGAIRWSLFEDPEASENGHIRFTECFLSSSMGEHLRQHHRNTKADREILAKVFRLDPSGRPRSRHLVAVGREEPSLLQRFWQ